VIILFASWLMLTQLTKRAYVISPVTGFIAGFMSDKPPQIIFIDG
jgi:hypothetical protein